MEYGCDGSLVNVDINELLVQVELVYSFTYVCALRFYEQSSSRKICTFLFLQCRYVLDAAVLLMFACLLPQ